MQKKLCLLLLVVNIHLTSSASHALQYLHTAVIRGVEDTEFSTVAQVDGEQTNYDDITKKILDTIIETETIDDHQHYFIHDVISLMEHFSQTGGVHTLQLMHGCELDDDGSTRGYSQYGYDGEDFLSLDLNTLTWTAANDKANIIKQEWEREGWARYMKAYLMNECIEWLKKFVEYGRDTLERKVPPEVSVFQKDSSSPVVCHATGFFPKSVMIYWQKNGEYLYEDMGIRETLPNQDGTFQKRSILTVSPEELDNHDYTCIIQHSSLEKEMVFLFRPDGGLDGWLFGVIVDVVVAVLVLIVIVCFLFFIWKKKFRKGRRREMSSFVTASEPFQETPMHPLQEIHHPTTPDDNSGVLDSSSG